jgi:predicted AlkP superfamily pyrophosphatase or phosphodiesterase
MKRAARTYLTLTILANLSLTAIHVAAADSPQPPKLVVAIVIDQFRYDYLLRFRDDYNSGLKRLLEQGAVFTDAHYIHATTVTAVGHSTFLSGATPSVSGIVANEWFDRATGKTVTSVSDPQTKLVGGIAGQEGSSPRRLIVSTVADELKMRFPDSHVIGVSIKDRSAILPAGHMADAAYWYDNDSNHWVTSTYFRKDLPDWAKQVNDRKYYQSTLGAQWLPFDAKPTETQDGKATPFCTMANGGEIRFCGGIEATPWGNEMIEQFAEAALQGERLGRHATTDILAVSYSSNDYVGHAVGPDDPAVRDISIRTDRLLGQLFDAVEKSVGMRNTLVILTADHGVAPVPEVNVARKMPGGRLSEPALARAIDDALVKRFGPGKWRLPGAAFMPYLNLELIRGKKLDPADFEKVVADAALGQPHIARAYTRADLLAGRMQRDTIGNAVEVSFYGPRSQDVYIVPEPYYLFDGAGTSHGTPYDYDNHVPVIFMGQTIKPGSYAEPIAVNDVAPTLAYLLGIERPSGSFGRVLAEIMK